MDDLATYALLTASFFFVALSFALLLRYRQISQRINVSTDLGRDLWSSLEQRLKKQDERILDMMGRFEVVQSRVMAVTATQISTSLSPIPAIVPPKPPTEEGPKDVTGSSPNMQQPESQESQKSQESQTLAEFPGAEHDLDETQLAAIKLLAEGEKSTRQLTDALMKSREHTARIMKELFELGLVSRNDKTKPFVYQLTGEGRRHLT